MNAQENEETTDVAIEEEVDEKEEIKQRFQPHVRMPKWLRIILSFLPAFIYAGIILLVDHYVGFPEQYNPIAFIALPGIVLFVLVVIGDMAYRNYFTYKMLRQETRKTRVYRQILKDRKKNKKTKLGRRMRMKMSTITKTMKSTRSTKKTMMMKTNSR